MKTIPMNGSKGAGLFAIVDNADYERVGAFSWHLSSNGYVKGYAGGRKTVLLHRYLLDPGDSHVDHRNGNRLDNRRQNLRLASRAENNRNAKQRSHSQWPFKGVRHNGSSWVACIRVNNQRHYLGAFPTAEEAAAAYDRAAHQMHGAFARPNGVTE